MNAERIRQEVFKLTGKGIELDDPFFVAVAMLSAVTDDMERKHTIVLTDLKRENAEFGIKAGGLLQALKSVENKKIDSKASAEELEKLIHRAYNQEREATRWLIRAHKKLDVFLPILIGSSVIGGLVGGAMVALVQRFI